MDADPRKPSKLLETDQRYEVLGKIGEGTYGNVFMCRDRHTGTFVAIKRIYFHVMATHQDQDEGYPGTALREICLLKELNHICIVIPIHRDQDKRHSQFSDQIAHCLRVLRLRSQDQAGRYGQEERVLHS